MRRRRDRRPLRCSGSGRGFDRAEALDDLKRGGRTPDLRDAAQRADRRLKGLRTNGDIRVGVRVVGDVYAMFEHIDPKSDQLPSWLDLTVPDDRFVASSLLLQSTHPGSALYIATATSTCRPSCPPSDCRSSSFRRPHSRPLEPPALPLMARVASPVLRRMIGRPVAPGASLELLPPAPIPEDLGWARGDPVIAEAFGRAATRFEAIGTSALPDPVRQLVTNKLHAWRGEDPGLLRSWVDRAVEPLLAAQRPLGRLALLAAFASHQVDAGILTRARTQPGPAGDVPLVATAAWASVAATPRIGSWLHTTPATATDTRGPTT